MKITNTRVLKSPQQTSFFIGHDAHVVVHPRQPFSQVDNDMACLVVCSVPFWLYGSCQLPYSSSAAFDIFTFKHLRPLR